MRPGPSKAKGLFHPRAECRRRRSQTSLTRSKIVRSVSRRLGHDRCQSGSAWAAECMGPETHRRRRQGTNCAAGSRARHLPAFCQRWSREHAASYLPHRRNFRCVLVARGAAYAILSVRPAAVRRKRGRPRPVKRVRNPSRSGLIRSLVGTERLELSRVLPRWNLNPVRLPIPPRPQSVRFKKPVFFRPICELPRHAAPEPQSRTSIRCAYQLRHTRTRRGSGRAFRAS